MDRDAPRAAAPARQAYRARSARLVATSSFIAILILSALALWMIAATWDEPLPPHWGFRGFEVVLGITFGAVGALIVANRPQNRLGWIILGASVVTGFQAVVDQYPIYASTFNPPLPYAGLARWLAAWIWTVDLVALTTLLPLLFPTGRLQSARWRPAYVLALVAWGVLTGSTILASQPIGPVPPSTDSQVYFEQIGPAMGIGYVLLIAAVAAASASAVVRYRGAVGDEKLQMKWLAFVAVLLIPGVILGVSPLFLGQVLFVGVGVIAAAALGVAMLRYRLYEIDFIVNRALVYGAMSGIVAGIYAASITLTQRLFLAATGNDSSDAAIVLTTLILASTFTPIRTRVQAFVDKRIKPVTPTPVEVDPATVEAVLAAAEKRLREIAREELARAATGGGA